jgi:GNAT superfamily N-acetyltransferase
MAESQAPREASVKADAITIRRCLGLNELRTCVSLQKEIWNFTDAELVPLRMFVVAEKVGGQVMGAFDNNEMVGFALSVPGTRSGYIYLHSHMLAVRAEYRNTGLGRRLKLLQREDALARGIELIEWTFDPLEIKNAYLNIEKLGAIACRYNINQYGITSSPLQVAEVEARGDPIERGEEPAFRSARGYRSSGPDLRMEVRTGNALPSATGAGKKSQPVLARVRWRPRGFRL